MTWRNYLRVRTRRPAFLWRMVLAIIALGVATGLAVDAVVDQAPPIEKGAIAAPLEHGDDDLDALAADERWGELFWRIPRAYFAWYTATPGVLAVAVVAGLCWLAFALQAVETRAPHDGRTLACLAGFALGVLSVWPTVFLIYLQEHRWGLVDGEDLATGVRYNILGVGLREELAKLACLLPLVPWLARRGDDLTALLASGCVGLGFAVEENCDYYLASGGQAVIGRFLTANPFHMALTGLVGLAAYRAVRWPMEMGGQFVAVFAIAVVAHGMYDAFMSVPQLAGYGIASMVIFALTIYQFFRELRTFRRARNEPVSLSANFLAGLSITAAAMFIYLCAAVGARAAFDGLALGVAGDAVLAYLFLREMPETLVSV